MTINFTAESKTANVTVNAMTSTDGNLYAECVWPDGTEEDYGYMALKAAIIDLATAHGIDASTLVFWYDGQEQYLSADAKDMSITVSADWRGDAEE